MVDAAAAIAGEIQSDLDEFSLWGSIVMLITYCRDDKRQHWKRNRSGYTAAADVRKGWEPEAEVDQLPASCV